MALDFIKFIGDNTPGLTATQKQAMLRDFCEAINIDETPSGKMANEAIQAWITGQVNTVRRRRAEAAVTIERLNL